MWILATTLRRWRSQWRLLLSVTAVALLACTLVTSLVLLVTATEQAGVRGALRGISAGQSRIDVLLVNPSAPIADARHSLGDAVQTVLGRSATVETTGFARSEVDEIDDGTFAYFGEYDGFESQVKLLDGSWPAAASSTPLDVAVPEAAALSLRLGVGSEFAVKSGSKSVAVRVVGVYRPDDRDNEYWTHDLLGGRGDDPSFGRPGVSFAPPVEAIGPLIAAPGGIDGSDLHVAELELRYQPSFDAVTVDDLAPLRTRVAGADVDIPTAAGMNGGMMYVSTQLGDSIAVVASSLIVTRSTVAVIALLLAVLAVAAMAQTARLFTDVRADERRMLRARGASPGRLLALGLVEALAIGVVTAALSPPLATLVYAALAAQAPMVAAGMPALVAATPLAWMTAGGVAAVLVLVLIAPLLLRQGELVDAERARPRRLGVFARSGLDVAIVAIAAVAFWQLAAYRSPVAASGSLAVDPVLAAGPAIALLACALVCVRVIPFAARALERVGQGGRGVLGALVGWEIGRRTRRATTTVLALSLALAVGTFALSFLATWRQSQVDQASAAIGPPARIAADPGTAFLQPADLAAGAGMPQPVTHRVAQLIPVDSGADDPTQGIAARVLALTPSARSMLDRGRLTEVGGGEIARALRTPDPAAAIDLGSGVVSITATATISAPDLAAGAVNATVTAIIEDESGLLGTVDLGVIPVDGAAHDVTGAVAGAESPVAVAGSLKLSGIRISLAGTDEDLSRPADAAMVATVAGLAVTRGAASSPVSVPAGLAWSPVQAGSAHKAITALPGISFDATVPTGIRVEPAIYALVGWKPLDVISAVVPTDFATTYSVPTNSQTAMLVNGIAVPLSIAGHVELVPGGALLSELGAAGSLAAGEPVPNLVVDETSLARLLLQKGYRGVAADEWWMDAPAGTGGAYVRQHPGAVSIEDVAQALQQAPLRVATQAALWLALATGGILAAVGFAVQTVATVRERRLEFAQLQAIGLGRRRLTAVVAAESALLVALGSVFGVGIGLALAWFVGPLVTVSVNGKPPVPSVIVEVPWIGVAALVGVVAVVLVGIVVTVAAGYRAARPADLLRAGGE